MLFPVENKWNSFVQAIEMFSDDYMADGRDEPNQERETF